jgi:hypothetical protein
LIVLTFLLFALGENLLAGSEGSVQTLFEAVSAAIHSGQSDADVARTVRGFPLTEGLSDAVIEELENQGAGSSTIAALQRQQARTRKFPVATVRLFEAQPQPSAAELAATINHARDLALEYSGSLPNFVCTESVERFVYRRRDDRWVRRDSFTLAVRYVDKRESYGMIAVNGRATTRSLEGTEGVQSTGEFGSAVYNIFRVGANPRFQWQRWSRIGGRLTQVLSFRIDAERSRMSFRYHAGLLSSLVHPAVKGFVFIDNETSQILRVVSEPEALPSEQDIVRAPSRLDYQLVKVGERQFLLPSRAEIQLFLKHGQRKNVMTFRDYAKFTADVRVSFPKQ